MVDKKEKKYVSDNAQLMTEWNWEKNNTLELDPHKILCGSVKNVWWICKKNHEWQATITNRNNGRGCPYCSNAKVLQGYNDLQTINPSLANEWNYEKNIDLTPLDVVPNSNKKVWWKCNQGHEWQAMIASRNKGNGCPYCSGRYVIKGKTDLQTVNPTLANEWNYEKNNGTTPSDVMSNSHKNVWWKCSQGHSWQATITSRNSGNGCPVCNSERQTSFPEYAIVYYLKKSGLDVIHSYRENGYELDIYIPSKKIAIEYDGSYWHSNKIEKDLEKNSKCKKDGIKLYRIREGLPPLNDFSIDYLIQDNGSDFSNALKNILNKITQTNVNIDLERDAIVIENLREYSEKESSILSSNPILAREWNHEKNGNLKPEYLAANSNKKVWWKCQNGHEYQARIGHRNKGSECPYCSGIKALSGYNDLQTVNPALAKEWDYEKNNGLTPMDVMPNSGKKVYWKCNKGHEWLARIADRNKGSDCPECAKAKRVATRNKNKFV